MADARFIVAGSLIDGSGGEVQKNVFLAVRDGIITAIDPVERLSHGDGAAIDDFSHCTILPPLVDCSVSLAQSPSVDRRVRLQAEMAGPVEKAAMVGRHIRYCHAYGVLGVADSDEINDLVDHCPEGRGRMLAIRTAGRLIPTGKGGGAEPSTGGDYLKIGYSTGIEDEEGVDTRLGYKDLCRILRHRGGKKVLAEQISQLRFAGQAGVRVAVGTGAGGIGVLHGESMVEEMKLFIKAGFSLTETILCASEIGARFFGMENRGQLTVGRRATFLLARGTVQQLPRKLSYLEGINIDGAPSSTYHKTPVRG
jgi:imidazolonepropionase-like amidohydrolase